MVWLLVLVVALISTELVGYVIHRALHAGVLGRFSELHNEHHFTIYPPNGSLRSEEYKHPERTGILKKVGEEWVVPISIISIPLVAILLIVGVPIQYLLFSLAISLLWAWLGLAYMHKSFHLKHFWMDKSRWYKKVRRLHDIHHLEVTKNYGITFFGFDKIVGTFTKTLLK
jgi:sterol desaturase/sphingolipid hydroxylase (fatty acid hydroxylase superfamily)